MELRAHASLVDIIDLPAFVRDRRITPANLVAIGLDARGIGRCDTAEVQHVRLPHGDTPQERIRVRLCHDPDYAYLATLQHRGDDVVVEGDDGIVQHPSFPSLITALMEVLDRENNGRPATDIFCVEPQPAFNSWLVQGGRCTPVFDPASERRHLRIRKNDILWSEGTRLVAAPRTALAQAGSSDCGLTIYEARRPIAMLSKPYGSRLVISTESEQIELELFENAWSRRSKIVETRRIESGERFLGLADRGGLKAYASLAFSARGTDLYLYPRDGADAPQIMTRA